MLTGFYTAASGMLMQQRSLNVLSNNMANINTPGFKTERVVSTTFEQELLLRQEAGNSAVIGSGSPIRIVEDVPTFYEPGVLEQTGRPFDMALSGEGFFHIQGTEPDQVFLTRNGNFDIDDEGYLVLRGAGRVLGEEGPILLGSSNFTVSPDGAIYDAENDLVDYLIISQPQQLAELQKFTNGLYIDPNAAQAVLMPDGVNVLQGMVERSNIDLNREMALAMEVQRAFQSCSSALKMIDEINQKSVRDIASL